MGLKKVVLKVTTAADGSATATSTNSVLGWLCAISYIPNTLDTGADLTFSCEGPVSNSLMVKANAGTSNVMYKPLSTSNQANDGSASTTYDQYLMLDGKIKLSVVQGGDTKTGSAIVYYFD